MIRPVAGKAGRSINYHVLRIFGPLLVLVGVAGFLMPPEMSLTSGAAPYNVFHIVFGLLAVALVFHGAEGPIRAFNAAFGIIDLYQAAASFLDLFPESYFLWKTADDVLHVVIGAGLLVVALAFRNRRS
jgi:hypothetical protein